MSLAGHTVQLQQARVSEQNSYRVYSHFSGCCMACGWCFCLCLISTVELLEKACVYFFILLILFLFGNHCVEVVSALF